MKKLGEVFVEFGNIALLKKGDKKKWEDENTGDVIGATFRGPEDYKLYFHIIKSRKWTNVKKDGSGSYDFLYENTKRCQTKLETLKRLGGQTGKFNGEYQVYLEIFRDNTYDRFRYYKKPILQINQTNHSPAYVGLTPDGEYDVVQKTNAVEVRFQKESTKEEEIRMLDELLLEEETVFLFEDLGYIASEWDFDGVEFALAAGAYIVEQSFDSHGDIIATRIQRK